MGTDLASKGNFFMMDFLDPIVPHLVPFPVNNIQIESNIQSPLPLASKPFELIIQSNQNIHSKDPPLPGVRSDSLPPPGDGLVYGSEGFNNGSGGINYRSEGSIGPQQKTTPENGHLRLSFADTVRARSSVVDLCLPKPLMKGNFPSIRIGKSLHQRGLDYCKFALVGRMDLNKVKPDRIRQAAPALWKINGPCKITPLGRGFFMIRLDNEVDFSKVLAVSTWYIDGNPLKIKQWTPGFDPAAICQSTANVWIRFPGLRQQFWDKDILLSMANAIGVPISVDPNTLDRNFGFYASVLVEVDMAKTLAGKIIVDIEDNGEFFQNVEYYKLPKFCPFCKIVGHSLDECRRIRAAANGTMCNLCNSTSHTQADCPKDKPVPKKRRRGKKKNGQTRQNRAPSDDGSDSDELVEAEGASPTVEHDVAGNGSLTANGESSDLGTKRGEPHGKGSGQEAGGECNNGRDHPAICGGGAPTCLNTILTVEATDLTVVSPGGVGSLAHSKSADGGTAAGGVGIYPMTAATPSAHRPPPHAASLGKDKTAGFLDPTVFVPICGVGLDSSSVLAEECSPRRLPLLPVLIASASTARAPEDDPAATSGVKHLVAVRGINDDHTAAVSSATELGASEGSAPRQSSLSGATLTPRDPADGPFVDSSGGVLGHSLTAEFSRVGAMADFGKSSDGSGRLDLGVGTEHNHPIRLDADGGFKVGMGAEDDAINMGSADNNRLEDSTLVPTSYLFNDNGSSTQEVGVLVPPFDTSAKLFIKGDNLNKMDGEQLIPRRGIYASPTGSGGSHAANNAVSAPATFSLKNYSSNHSPVIYGDFSYASAADTVEDSKKDAFRHPVKACSSAGGGRGWKVNPKLYRDKKKKTSNIRLDKELREISLFNRWEELAEMEESDVSDFSDDYLVDPIAKTNLKPMGSNVITRQQARLLGSAKLGK